MVRISTCEFAVDLNLTYRRRLGPSAVWLNLVDKHTQISLAGTIWLGIFLMEHTPTGPT